MKKFGDRNFNDRNKDKDKNRDRDKKNKSRGIHGASPKPRRGTSEGRSARVSRPDRSTARATPGDLCWGRNPVITLMEETPGRCLKVMLSKTMQRGMFERITDLCKTCGVPFTLADPKALDGMADGENHQGVVAVVSAAEMLSLEEAIALLPPQPEAALVVLFDHIQDPHNLGAMIRSAEAAGAIFACLPLRRSSLPTGTVVKTSAGASLRFPIASVGNVANAVRDLQEAGLWCVGLDASADASVYGSPLPARTLLVVGAEGKGIARTTSAACDEVLSIPIGGRTGSLNASVALGVAMFEWVRLHGER